jgi:hypothetical protein
MRWMSYTKPFSVEDQNSFFEGAKQVLFDNAEALKSEKKVQNRFIQTEMENIRLALVYAMINGVLKVNPDVEISEIIVSMKDIDDGFNETGDLNKDEYENLRTLFSKLCPEEGS